MDSLFNTSWPYKFITFFTLVLLSSCATQNTLEPTKPASQAELNIQTSTAQSPDGSTQESVDAVKHPPIPPVIPEQVSNPNLIKPSVSGALNGNIKLTNSEGKPISAEGTLIELIPLSRSNENKSAEPSEVVIDTKSKTYIPGYLTVNVGDTLVFTNSDPIKHNVFSSSPGNTFDLGTYGFNRIEKYQVKNQGIIKIYCNIHREMALFISASNGNPAQVADKQGNFSFTKLDKGEYKVIAWHPRGTAEKIIQISNDNVITTTLNIDTSQYTPEPRVNKHGKPYKEKPAIFEDEFY